MATLTAIACVSALEWLPAVPPDGKAWRVHGYNQGDGAGDSPAFSATCRTREELASWVRRAVRLGLSCFARLVDDPAAGGPAPSPLSPEQAAALDYLRGAIEHSPDDPGPLAVNLAGWSVGVGLFCCARCAGRILARGCRLPVGSDPVWRDNPAAGSSVCCLCGCSGGQGG